VRGRAGEANPGITALLLKRGARPDDHVLYLAAFDGGHDSLRPLPPCAPDIAATTALSAPIRAGRGAAADRAAAGVRREPERAGTGRTCPLPAGGPRRAAASRRTAGTARPGTALSAADELLAACRRADRAAATVLLAADRDLAGRLTAGDYRPWPEPLRSFAATGHDPDRVALEAAAPGVPADRILAELAATDFLTLDGQGRVDAAYPFSARPTGIEVALPGGVRVAAMCAIDALGIPAMLGSDAVITSVDPVSGDPVQVRFTDGIAAWQPAAR
jgi:Alkylmercury lyase